MAADPVDNNSLLIRKVLVEEKRRAQNEQLTVLESLRRSRKARGGVGAPLEVPVHLRGGPVILTDALEEVPEQVFDRPPTVEEEEALKEFEEDYIEPDEL